LVDETEQSIALLEYIINEYPDLVNAKSAQGWAPLHLAFAYHRRQAAHRLLQVGANVDCRDRKGNNILHLLLYSASKGPCNEHEKLKEMLRLLDPTTIATLATQCSRATPGAATPLARWLNFPESLGYNAHAGFRPPFYAKLNQSFETVASKNEEMERRSKVLETYLSFTSGAELRIVNAEGDTPLHVAVKRKHMNLAQVILERDPSLLHRENATGRTPLEMAQDMYHQEILTTEPYLPNELNLRENGVDGQESYIKIDPEWFAEEPDIRRPSEKTYDLCRKVAAENPGRRQLVTLAEANEVARRLALGGGGRYRGDDEEKVPSDALDATIKL
jgi:hypothetical protein